MNVNFKVIPFPVALPKRHQCYVTLNESKRGQPHLVNESVWAGMVVGEGFVNHQEHDAGEEGQSQDNENGDLGDNTDGQPGSVRERHYGCMLLKGNPYNVTRSLLYSGWNHFSG